MCVVFIYNIHYFFYNIVHIIYYIDPHNSPYHIIINLLQKLKVETSPYVYGIFRHTSPLQSVVTSYLFSYSNLDIIHNNYQRAYKRNIPPGVNIVETPSPVETVS